MQAQQAILARPAARPLTPTERNVMWALLIVFGGALLFWGILALEEALGRTNRAQRLVYHGVETSMRLFALSHFLVAILFMTTARKMRASGSWAWLAGLAALGVGICFGFGALGALGSPLGAVLFYAYFLVHEFRDETFFYVANGDVASGPGRLRRMDLWVAPMLLAGVFAAVGAAALAFRIGGARRFASVLGDLEGPARVAVGIVPAIVVLAIAFWLKGRYDRRYPGGATAFVREHRPIFLVFLAIPLLLMADITFFGRVYMIVTLHVTAWYVFSVHQLRLHEANASARARPFTWSWMRSTVAGFNFVHLGIAGLVVLAGVVWAYGFKNDPGQGALYVLLSRDAFPFWTIMHVTISFVPR